ncbi:MAG: ABC transporter permease [Chloroflexi bacterium]|nr:ABC transporter permease [Chloroflexota bacterium]
MSVFAYATRRLILLVFMLLAVSIITFTLSRIVPGDPARLMAGMNAKAEQVENMRERLGLDRPLPEQYLRYMGDLVRGDLGISLLNSRPVSENLRHFFPATLELAGVAFILAVLIGVPLGVISAVKRNTWLDHTSRLAALVGLGFPTFWLGIVLILIFFFYLDWLPGGQRVDIAVNLNRKAPPITNLILVDALITGDWALMQSGIKHLILPAITLAIAPMARFTRFTRGVMLEEMSKGYVNTARSKGLHNRTVIMRHVMRNAFIPTVTIMGLAIGFMLSGSVLVETIFNWPGIGQYAYDAVFNLDYPAILGTTLLVTVVFMMVNLAVDILYVFLDPRIEYR